MDSERVDNVQKHNSSLASDVEDVAELNSHREFHILITENTAPKENVLSAESVKVTEGSGFKQTLGSAAESMFFALHIKEMVVPDCEELNKDNLGNGRVSDILDFENLIIEALLSSEDRIASDSDIFEFITSQHHFTMPLRTVHFHICNVLGNMVSRRKIRSSEEIGLPGLYKIVPRQIGMGMERLSVPKNESENEPSEHYLNMLRDTIQTLDEGNGTSITEIITYIFKNYDFEEKSQVRNQFKLSMQELMSQNLVECIPGEKYTYYEEEPRKKAKMIKQVAEEWI